MSDIDTTAHTSKGVAAQLVFWLSVFFVILGMINAMPGIPGLDQLAADLAGMMTSSFASSRFSITILSHLR